ncbi:MAG: UDP-3-O-acyl-N-acetylglucosamine deacetylase [Phycisphaerales bacterium]
MTANARTIAAPATISGRGLFTGAPASVTIEPAAAGAGLALACDAWSSPCPLTIANRSTVPVHPVFDQVPPRCTSVGPEGTPPIATVEHALAALAGLGITDATLRVSGPEIPIDDGSARAFVAAIREAGVQDLNTPASPVTVPDTIEVERNGATITIAPADAPRFEYHLEFDAPVTIAPQHAAWDGDPDDFAANIAPARTFSFVREVEPLRALGLFASFTPADLLVIDDAGAPVDNELRVPDEFARHKLLDLIGDLALAGVPLCAHVVARRSGHVLNHDAAAAIFRA